MFGVNILAQFLKDRNRAIDFVYDLKPNALLVMDDRQLALDLAFSPKLPTTTVVYRAYDPHDDSWHLRNSASEIWNWHKRFAHPKLVMQIWNEPSGYVNVEALVEKAVDIVHMASADNLRVVMPMWGVGHPDNKLISSGVLDPLIETLYQHPEQYYGVHEYARTSIAEAIDEDHVLRCVAFLERAKKIGCPIAAQRIIVGEFGRDYMGRYEDGYRDNMTSEGYAVMHRSAEEAYRAYGINKVITFCMGNGGGNRWEKFNIEGDEIVQDALIDINTKSITEPPPAVEPPVESKKYYGIIQTTALRVNVREAPSLNAKVVTTVTGGNVVEYMPDSVVMDENGRAWFMLIEPRGYLASWAAWVQSITSDQGSIDRIAKLNDDITDALTRAASAVGEIKDILNSIK